MNWNKSQIVLYQVLGVGSVCTKGIRVFNIPVLWQRSQRKGRQTEKVYNGFVYQKVWKFVCHKNLHQRMKRCRRSKILISDTTNFWPLVKKNSPGSSVGRASTLGTGGRGFKLRLGHTTVFKNATSCSLLGVQTYRVELGLVDPVSG